MIRATTGGVMKTYRSNLMNSFINMNASRNTVLTQRTFNSFAEDPAAAAKAFRLRKSRMTVESQYSICTDALGKYQQAVSCLQANDDVLCTKGGEYGQYMKTLTGTTLSMLNGPTGDAREQLAKALDQMSQQVIQTMNQKYGDNFIFAGADGHNVPFEIRNNRLYYRGVPVDAAKPNVFEDKSGNLIAVDKNGKVIADPDSYKGQIYYLNMDNAKIVTQEEYDEIAARNESLLIENSPAALPDLVHSLEEVVERDEDGNIKTFREVNPGFEYEEDPNGTFYQYKVDGRTYWIDKDSYNANVEKNHSGDNFSLFYEDGCVEGEVWHSTSDPPIKYMYKAEDGTFQWITITQYENLKNARDENATQLVRVDADGTYNPEGNCYLVFDASQLMTKEEYEQQRQDYDKLQYLAQETQFVDIGFGFQEDPVTGKLIETSAFNAALNGINFLGYGLDEDGDPKNIYSLVQRMREISDSASESGSWDSSWDEFNRLVGKFEKAVSNYQTEFVNLDASTGKLKGQQELLVDNFDTLQEQYSDIEDVDMVDAITSFLWAEYCYNAALKVGNNILSESLMDYLR